MLIVCKKYASWQMSKKGLGVDAKVLKITTFVKIWTELNV